MMFSGAGMLNPLELNIMQFTENADKMASSLKEYLRSGIEPATALDYALADADINEDTLTSDELAILQRRVDEIISEVLN